MLCLFSTYRKACLFSPLKQADHLSQANLLFPFWCTALQQSCSITAAPVSTMFREGTPGRRPCNAGQARLGVSMAQESSSDDSPWGSSTSLRTFKKPEWEFQYGPQEWFFQTIWTITGWGLLRMGTDSQICSFWKLYTATFMVLSDKNHPGLSITMLFSQIQHLPSRPTVQKYFLPF